MAYNNDYGAAPTYVKLASQTLGSAASSVTFSNIPQGYTDLVLETVASIDYISGSSYYAYIQLGNGSADAGSNYSDTMLYGSGSGAASSRRDSNQTFLYLGEYPISTTIFEPTVYNIMGYSNSTTYKTVLARSNNTSSFSFASVGTWRSTSPVTVLKLITGLTYNYRAGSTFNLYGIKAALVPKASGGDIIVNDGTYWYHAFRTTGAFVPNQALTVSSLVIGGGGGGGSTNSLYFAGGGGGAGGYVYTASSSLTGATNYPITIGAGGVGATITSPDFGTKSTFNSINGYGGGRGYPGQNAIPYDNLMGSGGGASAGQTASATYLASGQGYKGGDSSGNAGGGGGGAGAAGGASTNSYQGGNGGAGLNTWSAWAYATGTGVSGYYAGGGGGGNSPYYGTPSTNPTTGGAGGGGNSSNSSSVNSAINGASSTGSGGGGGSATNTNSGYSFGGNGGSGIVIVRYPV